MLGHLPKRRSKMSISESYEIVKRRNVTETNTDAKLLSLTHAGQPLLVIRPTSRGALRSYQESSP